MSFLEKSLFCLLVVTLANILISVHGASIAESVSVSVSSSAESKSEEKTIVDNAISSRSLKSDESFENKVEISAPYARKVINNFSSEDKSRSLKQPNEITRKNEDKITTEKPENERENTLKSDETLTTEKTSEQDVTTQLNDSHTTNENVVKKIEISHENSSLKESIENNASKSDETITTEKTDSEQEIDFTLNVSTESSEKIQILQENQSLKESSETTTIAAITTSQREDEITTKTTEETIKTTEESESLYKNDDATFNEKSNIGSESDSMEAVTESIHPNLTSEDDHTERNLKRRSLNKSKSTDMNGTDKIHFPEEPPEVENRIGQFISPNIDKPKKNNENPDIIFEDNPK